MSRLFPDDDRQAAEVLRALKEWNANQPSWEDQQNIDRAREARERKRLAREARRASGAPPPEGGPTGRSVTFKADVEEP